MWRNAIFTILSILFPIVFCYSNKFPDINDLFNMNYDQDLNFTYDKPADIIVKNISIDLEKLDMNQFRRKMDALSDKLESNTSKVMPKQKLYGNLSNDLWNQLKMHKKLLEDPIFKEMNAIDNIPEDFHKEYNITSNISHDVMKFNDTRRLNWVGKYWQWNRASRLQVRNKLLEIMLQTIYMARYRIKKIENDRYFSAKDTSFRIGFLYRRLRRLWQRMMILWTFAYKRREDYNNWIFKGYFKEVEPQLVLHHKMARLHVDYVYLFKVMMKLSDKYEKRLLHPQTIPFTYRTFGTYWPPTRTPATEPSPEH